MSGNGESRPAHEALVDQIKAALATAPARSRVATPSPSRDGRGRFAAAQTAEATGDAPER